MKYKNTALLLYNLFSFASIGTLPSPQPGPSNTPLSSTMTLSSSSATSPVASPTTNGNILFGTVATSQMKPNLAATMETRSRSDLSVSVEDSSTPPNAHL
jgi:E3 ubiquitin-protein ligase TRIP12